MLDKPYIRKYDNRGDFVIFIVDGNYIRTNLDDQFTNFGQHYQFKFIPLLEFWLDEEAAPDEMEFYIDHLLVEHKLMAQGVPYEDAIVKSDQVERTERKKLKISRDLKGNLILPKNSKIHIHIYKKLSNDITVWIVDGRLVRNKLDIDFTEGGHDFVYDYVPKNEVWIDNDLKLHEIDYILLHELYERNLMSKGMGYLQAHTRASRVETYCRHHPDKLYEHLQKEGL